ncbi:MAG: hypothetical protein AAFV43_10920 [Planctomycetota bacterium]
MSLQRNDPGSHRSRGRWLPVVAMLLSLTGCTARDAVFGLLGDYYDTGPTGPMDPLGKRQHFDERLEAFEQQVE